VGRRHHEDLRVRLREFAESLLHLLPFFRAHLVDRHLGPGGHESISPSLSMGMK
jgi:hypothetical protein